MYGIMLLPDNWVCPNGLSFDPDDINVYTLSEWRQMEKAGAVFLPYTGERRAKDQSIWINAGIAYWTSSTEGSTGEVYRVDVTIDKGQIDLRSYSNQYCGYAVRLIRDAN
jgi:sugar lactone lactonase YvrE